jgi:hypothetical protein
MHRRVIFAATAVAVLAGCSASGGSSAVTAAHYSAVQQVVKALNHGHLPCVGVSYSNPPVVAGAISEASCDITAPGANFIDVFPASVTTTMVLKNSVSTGTTQIWNVVGPNWQVQTTHTYAKQVQKILGGRIIAGPWHPPPAGSAPVSSSVLTTDKALCKVFNANIGNGGESQIAQALLADSALATPKLIHDITKVLTTNTLHSNLRAQVQATFDCAEAGAGTAP